MTTDAGWQRDQIERFLTGYFADTEDPVFFCSLPQTRDDPTEVGQRPLRIRDVDVVAKFVQKWDRPKRALYFAVNTLRQGATERRKETISEIAVLHADIDYKNVDAGPAEICARVKELRLLPTFTVLSGNGIHCYWKFREAMPATTENIERIEDALKMLAHHVGGDPAVCEIARLMRLPGSHNSKDGAWHEVRLLDDRPTLRYDLEEIEEWLSETRPILVQRTNGAAQEAPDPWLAVATQFSGKPPVDVEQRLGAMAYGGSGESSIHMTQLSVSASLLCAGTPVEEVVAILMTATQAAAGAAGAMWSWRREEHALRRMCETWVAKHPEVADAIRERQEQERDAKEAKQPPPKQPSANNDVGAGADARINPEPAWGDFYTMTDFSGIPQRQWLHAHHYIRGHVVMTVGPAGWGKTSLCLCNAIEMITGRGLLGPPPNEMPVRVMYWNAEDPDDEMERRIAAICLHYDIPPTDLHGKLLLGSKLPAGKRLASLDRTNSKVMLSTKMLKEIEQDIVTAKIDCLIIDPLIAFHQLKESDNTHMDILVKGGFGEMAVRQNMCVELLQHTRKVGINHGDLTADDARGASSTIGAVRSVRIVNRMTAKEAEMPKIPPHEQRLYLRIDRDKSNLAPPSKATWIHLVSVELPNGPPGMPGDNVQAAEPWKYPEAFEPVTVADMHWIRDLVRKQNYRKSSQSDDWIGLPLAARLKLNPADKGDRQRLNTILATWFANGVLTTELRRDENSRKLHPFVAPGPWRAENAPAELI
jgi:hypothetical protein